MKGRSIFYSKTELSWIEEHKTLSRRDAHARFCAKFGRPDVSYENYVALCKRNGWLTGRTGKYEPGMVPANKGKKMPFNANSARTQFKKGDRPANTKYLGHERLHKDGYIYISVDQKNPHTGYHHRYVLKHKYLWEQINGKVPRGMCLKCLDDNRQNTDPSNWELIPRGALPFLNGHRGPDYGSCDPEVKPVVLTLAKLKHAKGSKQKNNAKRNSQ